MSVTTRWGIRFPKTDGSDSPPDVPLWMSRMASDLDNHAKDDQGTIAARPAAGSRGFYYYATDTGKLYRDNGTSWDEVALSAATAWATPTLSGSWAAVSSAPPAYRKDAVGEVQFRGELVTPGAGDTNPFTLPAGFRPPQSVTRLVFVGGSTAGTGIVVITTGGVVICQGADSLPLAAGRTLSLDGVGFATA